MRVSNCYFYDSCSGNKICGYSHFYSLKRGLNRVCRKIHRKLANEFATYQYDAAGRITQITQKLSKPTLAATGLVTTGTAATANPVTQVPVTYNISYDPTGRVTAFTQAGTATVSTPLSSITFTYDANGNRQTSIQTTTTLSKTGGTTAAPILTPSTTTTTRNYQIDPAGNKLLGFTQTMAQTGGATGGATSTANVAYSYDANGALLNDGLRQYAYDAEGRLAAASLGWSTPTGATTTATTDDSITKYAHNHLGQRVFKTAPLYAVTNPAPAESANPFLAFFESLWSPATTATEKAGMSYVYDDSEAMGGTLVSQTLTGGAQTSWGQSARYVYLPTASGPMPIAAIYGTKHYAIQSDHLNTPRRLIQSDGQVAWQWAYSAFGEEKPTIAKNRFANTDLNQSFGTTSVPAVTFNLRYPGQYFDQETGLHYNWHRSYDAGRGRYTQSDPIGLDGGWNRFGYAEQNPLEFTDPLGLDARCGGGKIAVATGQSGVYKCVDDGSNPNAKVCATAECAAGLLPPICDNRTIDEIDDSLDKSNCKRVCKPIVSSVMQVSPVPGSSYVAKKVICSKVCSK